MIMTDTLSLTKYTLLINLDKIAKLGFNFKKSLGYKKLINFNFN